VRSVSAILLRVSSTRLRGLSFPRRLQMSVKLFQAREPAFQRLQLPLLLAQSHRTSFRLGRGGIVDSWSDGPRDHPVVFPLTPWTSSTWERRGTFSANLLHGDRENLNSASHPYLRYLGAAAAKNGDGTQREEDRGENRDLTPVHS